MATTFPNYPASTLAQGEELIIFSGNQMHDIINGDSLSEVETVDGFIPTIRKTLVDNFGFKSPTDWAVGSNETVYNQLRKFTDGSWWWAPLATVSNPIAMTADPYSNTDWRVFSKEQVTVFENTKRLAAEAGYNLVGTFYFGCTITTAIDVVLNERDGKYYSYGGTLPKAVAAGSSPVPASPTAWVDRTDGALRSELAASDSDVLIAGVEAAYVVSSINASESGIDEILTGDSSISGTKSILGQVKIFSEGSSPAIQPSGAATAPYDLSYVPISAYRNRDWSPTWPIYKQSFLACGDSFPRFEAFADTGAVSNITISRVQNGLKFTNTSATRTVVQYRMPARFLAPCGVIKARVSGYSAEHRVGVSLIRKDNTHGAFIYNDTRPANLFSKMYVRYGGSSYEKASSASLSIVNGKPYDLVMAFGNNSFAGYGINENATSESKLKVIGQFTDSTLDIDASYLIRLYAPALYIDLDAGANVVIESFEAGYHEGVGHADLRLVTYENGEPVTKDGKIFFTASSRYMGINGGSGPITVYECDYTSGQIKPISFIVCRSADRSTLEAGTAAKILYDRDARVWRYVARGFPSPGGNLVFSESKENLLGAGLHLIDTYPATSGIQSNSLDADMIKIDGEWFIAYHGGTTPRTLRIAKSTDATTWTELSSTTSGEGITFVKANGTIYLMNAHSTTELGIFSFNKTTGASSKIGGISLSPVPGISPSLPYPWGFIAPLWNGEETKFLLGVFTPDRYDTFSGDTDNIFSYGDVWIFRSNLAQSGAEFYQSESVNMGY